MNRRTRYLLLTTAAIAAGVAWLVWYPDGRRGWVFYPLPGGAALRCQQDEVREWSWGGTVPHSGGGWPIFPRRRLAHVSPTFTLRATPPGADEHWVAWHVQLAHERQLFWDLWFDPAQERAVLEANGARAVLPDPVPLVPATCSRTARASDVETEYRVRLLAWFDVPATGSKRAMYSVTAFGAVEGNADGDVIRQEWSPDADGCFTKWWESDDAPQHRFGRYRPPWAFDRIDRRTSIFDAQLQATKGRFSDDAYLYRRGEAVVGVYWPWLSLRRGATPGAMDFCHVFGRCDDAGRTVVELLCVDAAGGVWTFGDVTSLFRIDAQAMHPHDANRPPTSPNDWLRYDVRDVESVLAGGAIPAPRRVE